MCVWLVFAGDMKSLSSDTKQELCQALEDQTGGWESLAHALGLGILTSAFRLSSCPAGKLLDSYEVNSFTAFWLQITFTWILNKHQKMRKKISCLLVWFRCTAEVVALLMSCLLCRCPEEQCVSWWRDWSTLGTAVLSVYSRRCVRSLKLSTPRLSSQVILIDICFSGWRGLGGWTKAKSCCFQPPKRSDPWNITIVLWYA